MKTYSAKPTDVKREWYVVDASEAPLGRLATEVAQLFIGKGKPQFTKHIDWRLRRSNQCSQSAGYRQKKMEDKMYYQHSGYPGGLKEANLTKVMVKDPSMPIVKACAVCLVNRLRDGRLARLKSTQAQTTTTPPKVQNH